MEALGFYKYTDPEQREEAKAYAVSDCYLFPEEVMRSYHADEEWLSEGGIIEFLERIRPILEAEGVNLIEAGQDFGPYQDYRIFINGEEFLIYTKEEAGSPDLWSLSTARSFPAINLLLERAGSEERLYLEYGGNDAQAVFLTPAMQALIQESPLIDRQNTPIDASAWLEKGS